MTSGIRVSPKFACPRCMGVRYGMKTRKTPVASTGVLLDSYLRQDAVVECELCGHGWREASINDGVFEVASPVHDSRCPLDCEARQYPVVNPDHITAPYGAVQLGPGHFIALSESGHPSGPEFGNRMAIPRRPFLRF